MNCPYQIISLLDLLNIPPERLFLDNLPMVSYAGRM